MLLDFRVQWNPFSDHLKNRAAQISKEGSWIWALCQLLEKGWSLAYGWSTWNCEGNSHKLKQKEAQSICAESTSKGVNQRLKDITQTQQQRSESPITWCVGKDKGHKLHQRYIVMCHWWELPQVLFSLLLMFCHHKPVFVTTKHVFCHNKIIFVVTNMCHDKHRFTFNCFPACYWISGNPFSDHLKNRAAQISEEGVCCDKTHVCRDKTFVMTKNDTCIILS